MRPTPRSLRSDAHGCSSVFADDRVDGGVQIFVRQEGRLREDDVGLPRQPRRATPRSIPSSRPPAKPTVSAASAPRQPAVTELLLRICRWVIPPCIAVAVCSHLDAVHRRAEDLAAGRIPERAGAVAKARSGARDPAPARRRPLVQAAIIGGRRNAFSARSLRKNAFSAAVMDFLRRAPGITLFLRRAARGM